MAQVDLELAQVFALLPQVGGITVTQAVDAGDLFVAFKEFGFGLPVRSGDQPASSEDRRRIPP
jgi:hypothetical protein